MPGKEVEGEECDHCGGTGEVCYSSTSYGPCPVCATSAMKPSERINMSRVLDPCCGSRMFWFDKAHPDVVFGDIRRIEASVLDQSHGKVGGRRMLSIQPDVELDFRSLPFPDGAFKLVVFDPPHLVRAGEASWMAAKYGKLSKNWRDDLRAGFAEAFRVLDADGVLIFKWNETQVKIAEVLALTPHLPLFGNTSGRKAGTHWMVFMKPEARP